MQSPQLPSMRRLRVGTLLSGIAALLVHCSWVLLNGSSVLYRLWTVLGTFYTRFDVSSHDPIRTHHHSFFSLLSLGFGFTHLSTFSRFILTILVDFFVQTSKVHSGRDSTSCQFQPFSLSLSSRSGKLSNPISTRVSFSLCSDSHRFATEIE